MYNHNRRVTPRNYILDKLNLAKDEKIKSVVLPYLKEYEKLQTEVHDIAKKAVKELNKKLEKHGFKVNEHPYVENVGSKYYNTSCGKVKLDSPCIKIVERINEVYKQAIDDVMLNNDFKEVLNNFVKALEKIK